jgi:hypothetical protein
MGTVPPSILKVMDDPKLFKPWFRDQKTWTAWRAFLSTLFGLPLDADSLELAKSCTSREVFSPTGYREAWLCCGRRAGKSRTIALIAVWLAVFHQWNHKLSPGERGVIIIIAADKTQATVILNYIRAMIEEIPLIKPLLERATQEELELTNNIKIAVHAASFRRVRGHTLVAALCDEIAFWRSEESANPDEEILAALRPGLTTTGGMLLCASSPYAKRGVLWQADRKHRGKNTKVLFWRAPTSVMNPTVPQDDIDGAYEDDPAKASSEYGAEFRSDVEAFISREALEAVVMRGVRELLPASGVRYRAFVDPSGGSQDSMTLAIAHMDKDIAILDCTREVKPPFSPEAVVQDFCDLMKTYRINEVTGDKYAGEWPREQFRKYGVQYKLSEKVRSELYRDLLPLLNSGKVDLLDNNRLISQLASLERVTGRSGRDVIDHEKGQHDDLANAAAGVLTLLRTKLPMRISKEALDSFGPDQSHRWFL